MLLALLRDATDPSPTLGRVRALPAIAAQEGLDPEYLSSLFQECLSTPPYRSLMEARMDRAREMMSNELLSIGDIARSVGYTNPLLFSRIFRKLKGVRP